MTPIPPAPTPFRPRATALAAASLLVLLAACGGGGRETPRAEGAAGSPARSGGEPAGTAPAASADTAAPEVDPAYRQEIEDWRARRVASLTSEGGWLSLVGLFWLEPGANLCGSDPAARVVLPASAPARVGTFELRPAADGANGSGGSGGSGGTVSFRVADGVRGLGVAGEEGVEPLAPGKTIDLTSDVADEGPTVLALDGLRFYLIDRDGRLGVRAKDRDAPTRKNFAGLDYYPIDPSWRIEARFEAYDPPKKIPVPNILGTVSDEPSPGALVFDHGGATYRLDAVSESGETDLFLIFGDPSNGRATYGGGRFLYTAAPDDEGRVVVDFNRAYNPPCAFTEYATCPLPPPQNKLPVAVEAGERRYAHSTH